jgi:hypothetical protein
LSLVDEKGAEFAPLAIPTPQPTWQPVRFKVHPGRYELRFRHQGPGWLVFSGTSNTTSLSLLAGRLVSFAHEFLYLGIASGAIALGLLWHRQNAEKLGVTDKT